jgi:polyisoprenoid-binding protein YceI
MTFTSTEFYGTPEKLTIKGKLTIKDVTKEVVFSAKLSNEVADPFGNTRIAISGTTKVSRKEFGMVWGKMMEAGPIVGDDVTIAIKAEFTKKLAK